MKPFTHRSNNVRLIPPTPNHPHEDLTTRLENMLKENQALQPHLRLMHEQAALMQREKHMAFVRAGFTDDQAFALATK